MNKIEEREKNGTNPKVAFLYRMMRISSDPLDDDY